MNSTAIALVAAIVTPLLLATSMQEASAHGNFEIVFGGNANNTLRVVIGETGEPAYVGDIHDLEVSFTDKLTSLPNTVANKNNAGTTILQVDTYFYPKSAFNNTSGGVPDLVRGANCNVVSSGNVQKATGVISGCTAPPGWTDKRENQNVNAVFGKVGIYTAEQKQFYTQYGRTLYHFKGSVNYFQNSPELLAPIDVWYDGKAVKVAYINNAVGTINSGFGLNDITTIYWPGSAAGINNSTMPDNIRGAIGTDRQNDIDIWNFLRSIAGALNSWFDPDMTIPPAK